MSKELTINSLGDAVRERVKSAIFSAIPDEAVDKLVQSEFKRMVDETEHYHIQGLNQSRRCSQLEKIIAEEIRKQLSEKCMASVATYLNETYQNQSKEIVQNAIKELAPIFMASMMESFASSAVQQLRNQLGQKGIYL